MNKRSQPVRAGFARESFPTTSLPRPYLTDEQGRPIIPDDKRRVTENLQVLYTFKEGEGVMVRDVSGVGRPLPLAVDHPEAVQWAQDSLNISGAATLTAASAARVVEEVQRTGEISVEAWLKPAAATQAGLASIVTFFSDSPASRNFSLWQVKDTYLVRLRTTETNHRGSDQPLVAGRVTAENLTHLVYTRDASGMARLYLDGEAVGSRRVRGDLSNWDGDVPLALGNEATGGNDHAWSGAFHLVAIYNRALNPAEVQQNFKFGADTNLAPVVEAGPDQVVHLEIEPGQTHTVEVTLQGVVVDDRLGPDEVDTTWTQVSGPGDVAFEDASAPATTADFNKCGTYVLRLTADDGALTASDEVTITVHPNQRPVVYARSVPSLVDLGEPVPLEATVLDDGLPDPPGRLTVTWSKKEGPGEVTFEPNDADYTQASFSQGGRYRLRLTARDGHLEAGDEVAIAVNGPPTVDAGDDQVINLPASAQLAGTVSDDGLPDPPGQVTVMWEQVDGPPDSSVTFADAGVPTTMVSFPQKGRYVLQLTADDGAKSTSDQVTVIANQVPAVDAGSDQVIAQEDSARLQGKIIDDGLGDPELGPVTVNWEQVSGPETMTLEDPHDLGTTVTFSQKGVYVLRLTVDNGYLSNDDQVTILVNQPPAVDAGPEQAIKPNREAKLAGRVTDDGLGDPQQGTITATWKKESGRGTVTFEDASALNTKASFTKPGDYVLRLEVSNSFLSASDTVKIRVGGGGSDK